VAAEITERTDPERTLTEGPDLGQAAIRPSLMRRALAGLRSVERVPSWIGSSTVRMAAGSLIAVIGCAVTSAGLYRMSFDSMAADVATSSGLRGYSAVAGELPTSTFFAVARTSPRTDLALIDEESEPAKLEVLTGRITGGASLRAELSKRGASPERIQQIDKALRPVFDSKQVQAGDFFALVQSNEGELVSFEYQRGRDLYRVAPGSDGVLKAAHSEPTMDRRVVTLGGVVNRSLFDSLREQGERAELVQEFAGIFVWTFDFSKESRPGDEYRLVYEKYYDRGGFVRYGKILAAQYVTANEMLTAVYYENGDGDGGYYTPAGISMRGSLLRAPLKYNRISSRYTKARLHPVHQVYKPHLAVDYAAPTGTPVWAAGDGEVVYRGWLGGLGRTVKVKHRNGYTTYYGHLSRYGEGISVGKRVRQKQVLGYVGTSGTATGPHLDYRVEYRGRLVDPLKVSFQSEASISPEEYERFARTKRERLERLQQANPPILLEAAM
jgi:murein DD-endopeptidase MepM/ murein hydrolase activator NlpD